MKKVVRKGATPENTFTEKTTDTQDSVELAMDAKGKYKPTIKIYFSPDLPASGVAESLKHLDGALREAFPGMIVGTGE